MKKPSSAIPSHAITTGPVTRSKASILALNGKANSRAQIRPDTKQSQLGRRKRVDSDENSHAVPCVAVPKKNKREVLKEISTLSCENSLKNCMIASKMQIKACTQKVESVKSKARAMPDNRKMKFSSAVSTNNTLSHDDGNIGNNEELQKVEILKTEENTASSYMNSSLINMHVEDCVSHQQTSLSAAMVEANRLEEVYKKEDVCCGVVQDIDSDLSNPQMCSSYAYIIHQNIQIRELTQRPFSNYMETVQRDINHRMRGILVDWLVEVADEYKLVPDSLYLSVYIIDCYLSQNYIERQRLQLLGITSMLIASKFEEISAPRIEEFCFITDSTYVKEEVIGMEMQVLKYLEFRLSFPTIKKFLRRFLRAAQSTCKDPTFTLDFTANYLAELTLVEYSFLKFLPSAIAASAVFLARWTLNQSNHPWNATLEYYTSYKASDLQYVVKAMQDLQHNSNGSLCAIREKYLKEKYNRVADRLSPRLPSSLF